MPCEMCNDKLCVFFLWDTFKLYIINAVKCVLTFCYAYCLSSVKHDVMSVLWNWLFYTGDWDMCAAISCSVMNIMFVSFKCNLSLLSLRIQYFSDVFKCSPPPFFICPLSGVAPYVCSVQYMI
jgi:hypothetical protein